MSDEPKYRDEEWLRERYVEEGLTQKEISNLCDCCQHTISVWLRKHDIQTRCSRDQTPEQLADAGFLRTHYLSKGMSVSEIAEQVGCHASTVRRWMYRHDIEMERWRKGATTPRELTERGWLLKQYEEKGRSLEEIASTLSCSSSVVSKWCKRHGIPTRKQKGEQHYRWCGGKKPYGPGWNDSKRRQVRERDGYECADCGTTQTEHKTEYDEKLHVHHLIKARDIDDPEERNAPENLITLCRDCHREWERLSEAGIRPQIDGVTAD